MNRLAAFSGFAALGLLTQTTAHAYDATADVTFTWGGTTNVGWTSSGTNTLSVMSNTTYFTDPSVTGFNSVSYMNPDFAEASDYGAGTTDDCLTPLPSYEEVQLRKYGCRHNDTVFSTSPYGPVFNFPAGAGAGPGAAASGTLTVTDSTLTGTLTVEATADEPTGSTTAVLLGVNIGVSTGNGFDGYNYRTADGSPFGNVWYGINAGATLEVNLTGTFTATSWEIDGGTATFTDPGFACQQGGFGGDARGTLCTPSTTGGGFQADGGHLDWGIDTDGSATGEVEPAMIVVRDFAGGPIVDTLSGVLASVSVDGSGTLTTNSGEVRRASGSASGGCLDHTAWDGTKMLCGSISLHDLDITGTVSTGPDTEPEPFTFADKEVATLSAPVVSDPVTISGINQPVDISVSGDPSSEYSIGCTGTFTAAPGTVDNGEEVCVRHTSAAAIGGTVDTILTVGTPEVSDTFTSTTAAADTDPDAFSFTDQTDVPISTEVTSDAVLIAGINSPAAISVTGGEYSVGCTAAFISAPGTVNNNDTVCVRHTSSAAFSTGTDTVLTVGTVSDTFTSTTGAPPDTTPDAFSFTAATNVALSTQVQSNTVTIAGITDAAPVSVTGGEYSIGCTSSFTSAAGTINDGETVCVRHTSSADFSTATTTTLDVGGVTGAFMSTTLAEDTTPASFSFDDVVDVQLGAEVVSDEVTITGINAPAPVSVDGGEYSIGCTGTFTSTAGTIDDGETVCVRHTAANSPNAVTDTTLTVGGVSDTFSSRTIVDEIIDGGSSALDLLIVSLLGFAGLARRQVRQHTTRGGNL
jgi:hypothetical protein